MVDKYEERARKYVEYKKKRNAYLMKVRDEERLARYKRNSSTMENYKQRGIDKDGNIIRQKSRKKD